MSREGIMKAATMVLAVLLASAAGAEMGMLKAKAPGAKKQAGVVAAFDGASLTLAVADGKKMGRMVFVVDALTQFKADKESLAGKPVFVLYTVKDGKNVARAVAAQEEKKKGKEAPSSVE